MTDVICDIFSTLRQRRQEEQFFLNIPIVNSMQQ